MKPFDSLDPSRWARRLSYAGLVPFVLLAVGVWVAGSEHRAVFGFALAAYGAVIASFLGAIHWGLAMRDASQQTLTLMGWGVLPSLLVWLALLLDTSVGLSLMAAVLWVCFAVDRVVYPRFQVQSWLPMRWALTCIASASCVAGAVGLGR